MKILFALLLSVIVPTAVLAQECIPQAEMQEIAKTFKQYESLSHKDYCYDGSPEAHLLAGIQFMRRTQFRAPMDRSADDLFSGKFASDWWTYFIGRITEFEIDDSCPKGVVAYVYAWGGQTMYACTAALTDAFTPLDLASVFMHEARHIDGFPHTTCSHGPRQGLQGACDTRISDGGSYAVTVETYSQLARFAQDVHPALKAYARSASVIYADEAFERAVRVDRTERFLVMTKDRQLIGISANGAKEMLGTVPELGRVMMRSQHMVLFPDNVNSRARFMFARGEGEVVTSPGLQADEYNALSPADRPSMVDAHSGAQWNARVYKSKVRFDCDPRSPNTQEVAVSDAPVGMLYPNGYDRGVKTAHLMGESGRVYDIGCQGTTAFVRPSALTLDQKYKSLYKVAGTTLGLTSDGNLREVTGTTSRPFTVGAGADGQIHEIMPNQVLGFFSEK